MSEFFLDIEVKEFAKVYNITYEQAVKKLNEGYILFMQENGYIPETSYFIKVIEEVQKKEDKNEKYQNANN